MYKDIQAMHEKYGVHEWVKNNPDKLTKLMDLRIGMLSEEYTETLHAYRDRDPEELIDGLIDVIVIAIGTLDIVGVDVDRAWNSVLKANMAKEVGVKPSRPNPLGLPDLIKPDGWNGPDHSENHTPLLMKLCKESN